MAQGNLITRFIDADKEPTKTLTPIRGYEKKELVSLEKAVNEIEPAIDDRDTMIWTAKRNARNPEGGLTPDESAAIHLYTLEWPDNQQSVYTLLNRLPSLKKTIWRGIRGNVSDFYHDDFIWWGC